MLDDTLHLRATVLDAQGHVVETASLTWSSSAGQIASVTQAGVLTALSTGIAEIEARSGAATARWHVTVVPQYTQVSVSGSHTCAVNGLGRLLCWGSDASGALGVGSSPMCSTGAPCRARPTRVFGNEVFVSVSAGSDHTCARVVTGGTRCWGRNHSGQLGTGGSDGADTPVPLAGTHSFTFVEAGFLHTCGLTDGGAAYCWGDDYWGQLGLGSVAPETCTRFTGETVPCSRTPRLVAGDLTFSALTVGSASTCGLTTQGRVYCWGLEVGSSDGLECQGGTRTDCTRTPFAIGTNTYADLATSQVFRCARTASGLLYCWGADHYGMLGNANDPMTVSVPTLAAGGRTYHRVALGWGHVCALAVSGQVECWGNNEHRELGDGSSVERRSTPSAVSGGQEFVSVHSSAQASHTCAIAESGRMYCWGYGALGQLGDGAMLTRATPTVVPVIR